MNRKQNRSSVAVIERLEGRQLMSGTHLTVPALAGDVFTGTATSSTGETSDIVVTILSESKSGKLTGTVAVDHGNQIFTFKGTVNKKDVFSLSAIANDHQKAKLTGHVSTDTTTLTGKFVATKPKHKADKGTFVLHR